MLDSRSCGQRCPPHTAAGQRQCEPGREDLAAKGLFLETPTDPADEVDEVLNMQVDTLGKAVPCCIPTLESTRPKGTAPAVNQKDQETVAAVQMAMAPYFQRLSEQLERISTDFQKQFSSEHQGQGQFSTSSIRTMQKAQSSKGVNYGTPSDTSSVAALGQETRCTRFAEAGHAETPQSAEGSGESRKLALSKSTPSLGRTDTNSSDGRKVSWQWEHRTGFKNYDAHANWRIEEAYQRGDNHTRLKTGKTGDVPMELFFKEMIQHDPTTGNTRPIRRVGPNHCWSRLRRWLVVRIRSIETGRPHDRLWELYQEQRQRELSSATRSLISGSSGRNYPYVPPSKNTCAKVMEDRLFILFSLAAVVLNCVWLCFQAVYSDAESKAATDDGVDPVFMAIDIIFCIIFTAEILVRFGANERKRKCFADLWFLLDSLVVAVMILEVIVMILRMFRGSGADDLGLGYVSMLRIIRLVRLIHSIPQLQLMIVSIWHAVPPIVITLTLLGMLTFVFALVFSASAKEMAGFGQISDAILTLVIDGVFLDSPGAVIDTFIAEDMAGHALAFLLFILLCGYMVMNLLIGILCEIVHAANEHERNDRDEKYLRDNMLEILECYDRDNNGFLDIDEFTLALSNPDLHVVLRKCSVDARDLLSFGTVLLEQEGRSRHREKHKGMSTEKLLKLVLRLRGNNSATVADIVSFREYLDERMNKLFSILGAIAEDSGVLIETTQSRSCVARSQQEASV